MILSEEARDYIVEYESQRNCRSYGEMTWDEINALRGWDCTTEEDLISCLDSDYIDMTEDGKIVFITHNLRW
jgi:hypothetical protein